MKMDLQQIKALAVSQRDLNGYIDNELRKCSPDDPPMLSDLIIGSNDGGLAVLQALEAKRDEDRDSPIETHFRWTLQVMRDEWGNVSTTWRRLHSKNQETV